MKDLPELIMIAILMFTLAWWAAQDEEEMYPVLTTKEVMNGHTKTQPMWQTDTKSTPVTRLLDSERLGEK
jgi:hypothetical protein